jgi:hypothetical protein
MAFSDVSTDPNPAPEVNSPEHASNYFLPANDAEAERLLMQHTVLIDALDNQIVCVPLNFSEPGLKILDSGTADGSLFPFLQFLIR